MIRKFLERCVIAGLALAGRLDNVPANLEAAKRDLEEAHRVEEALRVLIDKTQAERDYWYQLWFKMGSEFQAGQSALMDEIERLHRKHGAQLDPKMRKVLQAMGTSTKETFVAPKSHPSPAVKTPLPTVECPPKTVKMSRSRAKT